MLSSLQVAPFTTAASKLIGQTQRAQHALSLVQHGCAAPVRYATVTADALAPGVSPCSTSPRQGRLCLLLLG